MSLQIFSMFVGIGIASSLTLSAQAQSLADAPKVDLETQFYQELAKEAGADVPQTKGIFEEVPDGLSTKEITPACDPRRFEDSIIGKKLSTAQYYNVARAYFAKCSGELTQKSWTGLLGLLKFSKFQYPFFSHPQVKEFMVKLPDGTRVPGVLALKQDARPRPLVIVKCGVFCSASQSASMKSYLMHLFDQSPFNVLLLANQTGMDYIYYNKRVTLGGWSEGYEAIEVGKWMMEKWEHKDRISSLHLMGISLGGNAAVMGAAFNDKYLLPNGRKVYNSVTAICPVISLRPTLDHLYGTQVVGRAFAKMTKEHFKEARNYVADVPDLITDNHIPSNRKDMADYIGSLASTSLQRRGIASTTPAFFKSNNFWNLKEEVKTPLMVWASKDDSVVNNRINAEVMEHDDLYEKSANVGVLNLKYGNHCGFSSSYGAQASAAVLRTFVLTHSPEFVDTYNTKQEMPWTFGFKKLGSQFEHIGQSWHFYSNSNQAKVVFRLFNWNGGSECADKGPWSGSGTCTSTREFWVPISSLSKLGARVPRTDAEAQALTREFNTKVEFRIKGHPLNGTYSSDFYMTWRSHFE
ncbi:hypothetical protein [Bdellovibrio bacteriovorus]|uniref:Serine aminopeptidase S33 domain-containing protein n=1 Tax=Bdellovibrio bacteriovorus str. Tiberius TaxID=1069642 RepID=K7YLA8_BDEBC|nr:hypothetical protein [Bdellovibrio bacteriovorus]AFY00541.1 hypothetical protein Bdt_0840 [Bdellovibrio bacteriovorus str. Tiberius]